MMNMPSATMQGMALRLLAMEAASPRSTDAHVHEAVRVCEKLQISLTRFAGADGFTSLLRRAVALARVEAPALPSSEFKADCSLFEALAADSRNGANDAAVAVIAHLLELLVTFIGKPLTVRLMRVDWPDASFNL